METADTFRLGVVTDPAPGHEKVNGWLAIPYLGYDRHGTEQVWSIRFRCLAGLIHPEYTCKDLKHGKYFGMPHEFARVFNVRAIKDATDEIHITEGELDAVVLNQAGYPAVGLPGATQWNRHHQRMFAGFNRIYVWGDPDDAGAMFTGAIMQSMRNAAAVRLEVGDVSETFMEGGYAALDAAVEEVKWS